MTADEIVKALEKIYKDKNWGNHNNKIIEQCVMSYKQLSVEDRKLVRLVLPEDVCWGPIFFGVEMASVCLNTPNQETFTNGLYAFGIGYEKPDLRDVWVWLSTLVDSAIRTGLSYSEYFKSGEPFVEELQKYLMRPNIENILSDMRRKIVIDKKGYKHYE